MPNDILGTSKYIFFAVYHELSIYGIVGLRKFAAEILNLFTVARGIK